LTTSNAEPRAVLLSVLAILLFLGSTTVFGDVFVFDRNTTVVGRIETYETRGGESLIEVARKFSIGFNGVAEANPTLDPFVPGSGSRVIIPAQWILPDVTQPTDIVVNLSDLRLYYFFTTHAGRFVATFPIGIGDEGRATPLGRYKIVQKLVQPQWQPPPSIRAEDPTLPRIVPPGPDNPLGSHALRLSRDSVLIHGTNRPFGVGRRVSHGCMHLYPEDIPILFKMVPKGATVTVVRQPVKVGRREGRIYMEVHPDSDFRGDYAGEAQRLLKIKRIEDRVSMAKVESVLKEKNGIPADITKDEGDSTTGLEGPQD
jgi:L,D-transpeptidase ErfK/SrfK